MEPPELPSEKRAVLRPSRWWIVPSILGGMILLVFLTWIFLTRDIPPIDDSDLVPETRIVDEKRNPYSKIRELSLKPDAEDKIDRIREMLVLKTEPFDREFVEEVVAEYSEELAALDRFSEADDWKIDYEINWNHTSPETRVIRSLTRLKWAEVELLIASEEFSAAIDKSISMIQFGGRFRDSGGGLTHFLVGTIEIRTAQSLIAKIVQRKRLSEDQLSEFADRLAELQPTNDSMISALKVDYQMSSMVLRHIGNGEIDLTELMEEGDTSEKAKSFIASMFKENRTRLKLADVCRHSISETGISRKDAIRNVGEDYVSTHRENMVKLWLSGNISGHIFLSLVLPPTDGLLDRFAQCKTNQNIVTLQIAAERFRLKNGGWPEKLDELIPEFIDAIPIDHMDGKPVRYYAETYRIYSVGRDFVDDKGEVQDDRLEPFRDWNEPMLQLDPNVSDVAE